MYTSAGVIKILNIKGERFRQWIKRGYVIPTVRAKGSGYQHLFNELNLFKILIFKQLSELGLNRWISRQLSKEIDNSDKCHNYMTISGYIDRSINWKENIRIQYTDSPLLHLIHFEDFYLTINLKNIREKMDG